MSTQHAIYRCTPGEAPRWTFYSIPVSVLGGGDTLAAAKVAYREALAFALECSLDELPSIAEHTERELMPDVWVRMAQDRHQVDRQDAYEVLGELLKAQPEVVDTLAAQPAASGDAIIIASRGDDLIASVQEQMTSCDAVWIASRVDVDHRPVVWWMPLAGGDAEGVDVEHDGTLGQFGLSSESLISELYRLVVAGQFFATEVGPRDRVSPRVLV